MINYNFYLVTLRNMAYTREEKLTNKSSRQLRHALVSQTKREKNKDVIKLEEHL